MATMVPNQGYILYLIRVEKKYMDLDHGLVWDQIMAPLKSAKKYGYMVLIPIWVWIMAPFITGATFRSYNCTGAPLGFSHNGYLQDMKLKNKEKLTQHEPLQCFFLIKKSC